jgi:hypothetical protein
MKIDLKIIEEIRRYNQINNYITEQELPPPPGGELPPPPGGELPPPPGGEELPPPPGGEELPPPPPGVGTPPPAAPTGATEPTPVDIENDPDVEKIEDEKDKGNKEEIEVTDLVKSQKSVEEKQEEYFDTLFGHLNDLENKLSTMDEIISKLNSLETKIEKYRTKSPEERLELRTLDSGPFNQKLSQFFEDKEDDFEKTGREQYIITPDDVESYSPNEIQKSFRDFGDDEMTQNTDMSRFKKIY